MNDEVRQKQEELKKEFDELQKKMNADGYEKNEDDTRRMAEISMELERMAFVEQYGEEFAYAEGFVAARSKYEELASEVEKLKKENLLADKNVPFDERLKYVRRLQEIPKELDTLLESESLTGEQQGVKELREQIEKLKNDILDYAKEKINEIVVKQMKKLENIERHCERLFNELQYNFTELHDISNELNGLVDEFEEFKRDLPALKELIAEQQIINPYSISETELKSRVNILAGFLREIKRAQINNYNNMVTILNDDIEKLKLEVGLPEELNEKIKSLVGFSSCNMPVRLNYSSVGYLKEMNYADLIKMMKLVSEIKKDISELPERDDDKKSEPSKGSDEGGSTENSSDDQPAIEIVLEAELRTIENKVQTLNDSFDPEKVVDNALTNFINNIENAAKDIADFRTKLDMNKDKLDEEKYNEFKTRADVVEKLLGKVKENACNKKKTDVSGYGLFKQAVDFLGTKVEYEVQHVLNSKFVDNKIPKLFFDHIMGRLNEFETEIESLRKDINDRHNIEGGLDDTQFDNLNKMLDELSEKIKEAKNEIESYEIMKESGFLDLLHGDISSLEEAIEKYGKLIDAAGKPITKENRKLFDRMNKAILNDIATIEENLERYKDTDEEKYNAEVERLNKCKAKLEEHNAKYRSKCGLVVRSYRSAKNFFKKHKKIALIAAGLAAIAITHMVVGPVLIPAIMHGNLLIANKIPFLRPLLLGLNNLLGGAINAKIVNTVVNGASINVWQLSNGLMMSPSLSGNALLRGIAMVAGASAPIVTPLVVGVKKLVGKMKNKEKDKENNKTPNTKKKNSEAMKKVTDKIKDVVSSIPKKIKPNKKDDLKLLREYFILETQQEREEYKAGLSIEQQVLIDEFEKLLGRSSMTDDQPKGRGM